MKHLIGILFLSALFNASCTGQRINEKKVPSVVVNTLKATYQASTNVDWKKLNSTYEAEVDLKDDKEVKVRLDSTGTIKMTNQDILQTELLPAVLAFINEKYNQYTIDDIHKVENNGKVFYQVDLDARNKKDVQLVFSSDGKEETSFPYWD